MLPCARRRERLRVFRFRAQQYARQAAKESHAPRFRFAACFSLAHDRRVFPSLVKPQQARTHGRTENARSEYRGEFARFMQCRFSRGADTVPPAVRQYPAIRELTENRNVGQPKRKAAIYMEAYLMNRDAGGMTPPPSAGIGSRPRRHTPTNAPGGWYDQRVLVPLPAPVICPHCGSSDTCMRNGVSYNLRTATRMEARVCRTCNFSFTGARPMTREERQRRGVA